MNQTLVKHVRLLVVSVCSLFIMVLFTACSGTLIGSPGPNGSTQVTGSIVSTNPQTHSVVLNVNGQQVTVSGLTDAQVQALQTQAGKQFTIQVTQAGTNTYSINTGTDPQEDDNGTPGITAQDTPEANEPGSIEYIGSVQSSANGNITVRMPDGQSLQMNIVNGQSDLGDSNGIIPGVGQLVQVKATANPDGSFMLSKLDIPKADDIQEQNIVSYQGITTSAVGPDHKLNFKVGNKSFSYQIGVGADLKDFANNAQSIGNNMTVKVKVVFNGSTGSAMSVDNANS
ncbi:MAG TPA: hypothetical protein VFU49_16710 [Ktedonobacteraceae bacterium]|nr:hypothetical protein [Ktedonobacteraceae bacterium]